MIYIVQNLTAILLATGASLAFGAIYYRGGGGMQRRGGGAGGLAGLLLTAFVAEFWLAAILAGALILAPAQAGLWTMTLGSALIIWIGFVVPVIVATYRLRGLDLRAAMLDCGHWLGVMLLQATVLRLTGLVPPT